VATYRLSLTTSGFLPDITAFAKARNCFIEAPTGSGKTTAFVRFANAHRKSTIFYAAQTIVLVNQTKVDLQNAGITTVHYEEFSKFDDLHPGVYVTTNESLRKLLTAAVNQGKDYILVIDEVHIALDDFMSSNEKNELLERAVMRSKRSFFMTATITSVQLAKLADTVYRSCGAETPETFSVYSFAPHKSNPLKLRSETWFGRDFVALLESYQTMKKKGETIPRTVIIVPTSKLRRFQRLLEHFDLLDEACVASRHEATQANIDAARVSTKPILVSSPLFALGLNFDVLPLRLWTYFQHLHVDTSQIDQTLNRGNRDEQECEARLYHGKLNDSPIPLPPLLEQRARTLGYLQAAERVNDFATPGVMNLLCGAVDCVRGVSPVVAG
jgi:hypothetical protein